MANLNDPRPTSTAFGSVPRAGGQVVFDAGLRKHMLSIYNYMTSGVLLTGIVALLTFNSGLAINFASGPMMWIVALSPLAIVFATAATLHAQGVRDIATSAQAAEALGGAVHLRRGVLHLPELTRRARYGANAKAMTLTSAR